MQGIVGDERTPASGGKHTVSAGHCPSSAKATAPQRRPGAN